MTRRRPASTLPHDVILQGFRFPGSEAPQRSLGLQVYKPESL